MKKSILYLFLFIPCLHAFSQVVVSDPALPFDNQPVTIIFDATQGSGGLKDYTGDVYAHTGVLTKGSTGTWDWKYVKTSWGENTADTKLTRVDGEANLYELSITPSIREYYGVPASDTISHMAFVFRSDFPYTGSTYYEGKDAGNNDIFVEVYEEGLNVSISSPGRTLIADKNTDIAFAASSTAEVSMSLYLNEAEVKTETTLNLTNTFNFAESGDYWIKVVADDGNTVVMDSVFVHILGDQVMTTLPDGMQEGINYVDDHTVTLVLYAPLKQHVFVIGDFNDWNPYGDFRMNLDGDRYWCTIDGLVAGTEYAYQYLVDGNLTIGDPYADKVLDPNNDKWITDETYPGLKEYPTGLTDGIVTVLQTGQAAYQWQNEFVSPDQSNLVIYELLVRDFIASHDWKTLNDTLDYFSSLGVNALEIMPFNEFEGNESWGYNPSYYFAPDKYYGPKDDLKAFIDACHGRGIAVIMDMVFNHSFGQSPLVRLYMNEKGYPTAENPWYNEDYYLDDEDGWYQARHPYSVGYDFDHSSLQTQAFIDRVNSYWMEEYKIDGFRFDLSKGFTQKVTFTGYDEVNNVALYNEGAASQYDAERIGYLKRMADQIWSVNPDAYVILEHFTDNSEEKELAEYGMMTWGNLNYNYNEATMGWNDNGKSDFSWISYQKRGWSVPHLVGYMESHDEERLMVKNLLYGNAQGDYDITELVTALSRIELAGSFFFTIPGPKMIWQFGEMGYDYSIEYNGRVGNKPIRWDYYESRERLRKVFTALINLRLAEPAFTSGNYTLTTSSALKRIEINHADMDIRIIGNFDVKSGTITPLFSKTGTWYEYFSGNELQVDDVNMVIELAAGEYRIYTTKQLDAPDIPTLRKEFNMDETRLYPNPAEDMVHFKSDSEVKNYYVMDIGGRLLSAGEINKSEGTIDMKVLTNGIYLVKLQSVDGTSRVFRVIKK